MSEKIWTIKDIIDWSKDYFEQKGIENARLNIELILGKVLNYKRLDLYLKFDQPLKENELKSIREFVIRRGKREPLQYILGEVEFCDLKFKTDSRALIPRPETEELVNFCIDLIKKNNYRNIIDIGTGSGCIPISIKNKISDLNVYAIDISGDALELAKENAVLNKIEGINWIKLDFLNSKDWKKIILNSNQSNNFTSNTDLKFDLIISNPPYVTKEDFLTLDKELIDYEPHIALTDFADGLTFYQQIVTFSDYFVSYGGSIVAEIGYNLSDKLNTIYKKSGYHIEIYRDMQNIDRILHANKGLNI